MQTKDKVFKIGLIGCGRISKIHTSVISNLANAKLAAVCDIVKEKSDLYSQKYNCQSYIDYKELINANDIDIVDICTPTYLHSEMAVRAACTGKHVITEKPMAISIREADSMIEACKKNSVNLFIVKQNRYNPPIIKLKEAIDDGRFGKIFYGNTTVFWYRDQRYYDEHDWFRNRGKGGGVIINQASHNIDMLQWLMGPVESVYTKIDTMTHTIETEDLGLAILKFKTGAWGTIEATTSAFPRNLEGSVTIFGENGSAKVGGIQMNEMQIWEFKDTRSEDAILSQHSVTPSNVYGFGHIKFMEDVIKVLQGRKIPYVDGEQGKASLELILAMYESSYTNKIVNVSEFIAKERETNKVR